MPELPEVETVRRGLEQTILGKTIEEIAIRRHDLRIPIPDSLPDLFHSSTIESIERRSKYLLLKTNSQYTLLIHLGMSGKIVVHPTPPTLKKHDHVIITFADNYHLTFNDPRRFGIVTYDKTNTINDHNLLKKLGPEPLTETFDGHYLHHMLSSKKAAIKTTIMDSHVVVGVGNIYAAESLFRSRISPTKASNTLTQKECETLCQQIKNVLRDAITSGGSTLRDYVRSSGDAGYFQHHFQVYGRENEPCFQCQNPIKKIRQTGRSTYYCPQCQK